MYLPQCTSFLRTVELTRQMLGEPCQNSLYYHCIWELFACLLSPKSYLHSQDEKDSSLGKWVCLGNHHRTLGTSKMGLRDVEKAPLKQLLEGP